MLACLWHLASSLNVNNAISILATMPGKTTTEHVSRHYARKECYLKKKRGNDAKFKEDMSDHMVLQKWPKFLELQVKLPDPGEPAALVEMRTMCPGKPATLEEISEICKETPFRTPFWEGRTVQTDVPERVLAPGPLRPRGTVGVLPPLAALEEL